MEDKDQELAIGIDLGTTYCCVAVFRNGSVEVIANEQGSRITPSTVAFSARERLVGESAQFQRLLDPGNVVYNAKRFIGRKFEDPVVQENKTKFPFKFQDKNNKVRGDHYVFWENERTKFITNEHAKFASPLRPFFHKCSKNFPVEGNFPQNL